MIFRPYVSSLRLLALAAVLTLTPFVRGQQQPAPRAGAEGDPAAASPSNGEDQASKIDSLLAARFAQLARSFTTGDRADSPPRLHVALTLLDQALRLAPADAELQRLRIEALARLDENQPLRDALRQYLKLAPGDDAAQLRLIERIVADAQTAEQRLAIYRRLLEGDRADRLSSALRSRVALRAAALHRRRGDTRSFGRMLQRALSLDPANAEAADRAYQFLLRRGAEPVPLAQALLNLLAADPSRADAHAALAATLLHCGAYAQAVRWFESAAALWNRRGRPAPARARRIAEQWALALWGAGRPDDALAFIQSFHQTPAPQAASGPGETTDSQPGNQAPESQPGGEAANNRSSDEAAPANETRNAKTENPPSPGLQSVAVAIHTARGDRDRAAEAFQKLIQPLKRRSDAQPDNPDPLIDRAWARLLFNQDPQKARPLLDRLEKLLEADNPLLNRLRGFQYLRAGRTDQARRTLQPLARRGDGVARYGLTLISPAPQTNTNDQKAPAGNPNNDPILENLQAVHAARPGGLIALLAAQRIARRGAQPRVPSECQTIARLAGQTPPALRSLPSDPYQFVALEAQPDRRSYSYAQPIRIRITLTNASPLPLGLGPGQALPDTALLETTATVDGEPGPALDPQIVSLDRRLRLRPRQSLTASARLDTGALADLLNENPAATVRLRTAVILNPVLTPDSADRRITPGLLGVRLPLGEITRAPAFSSDPIDADAAAEAIDAIRDDPDAAAVTAAALARSLPHLTGGESNDPADAKLINRITGAINDAYARFSAPRRAFLISHLPTGENALKWFGPTLDQAVHTKSTPVLLALLASQVRRADSSILSAALRRGPGPVHDFARRLRTILRDRSSSSDSP